MKRKIKYTIIIGFILLILYFLFTNIFVYPFRVEGMSMFPTIAPDEIKLANKWKIITKQELHRNDIVIFEAPSKTYISPEEFNDNLIAEYDKSFNINPFKKKFIKRLIGLPGDYIKITEENDLYVNNEKVGHAYKNGLETFMFVDLVVPENCIYVLGDNSRESVDSRSFGCIPIEKLDGILE